MANRQNAKGRSRHPDAPYWILPYVMIEHPSWRELSGRAIKVFCELHRRYQKRGDGITDNNGRIALPLEGTAKLLNMSKSTVARALCELQQAGFVVKTRQGQWYGRKASEWRLTDTKCDGSPPTRDWERLHREKQNAVPQRPISTC